MSPVGRTKEQHPKCDGPTGSYLQVEDLQMIYMDIDDMLLPHLFSKCFFQKHASLAIRSAFSYLWEKLVCSAERGGNG